MRLSEDECWTRLGEARHGVLATVHPDRGVDVVPAVFALSGRSILLPIDAVKAKSGGRLQRQENLARDRRCAFLVEEYDDDWSQLWWVRVHGTAAEEPLTESVGQLFGARYAEYRRPGAVVSALRLIPDGVTGWAAG